MNNCIKIETVEKRCTQCKRVFLTRLAPYYTEHTACLDCVEFHSDEYEDEKEEYDEIRHNGNYNTTNRR